MEAQEYKKLVKALRCCSKDKCGQCEYEWNQNREFCMNSMCADAAAAIEELQKDKAIANRKLDSALKKVPKCGKWIRIDKHTIQCPLCHRYLDLRGVNAGRGNANYCPTAES